MLHSSTVKILATSREGLRLADEQLWPVPRSGHRLERRDVVRGARVGGRAGRFVVESDDAGAVVEICRRLDGIPLGIELAASRLQSMTVTDIRDRLDDRFRLLVGSRRGLERHQTLRHAVQWSFDLLDDAEKSVADRGVRCSPAGSTSQGACAVAGSGDEFATLDLLDALIAQVACGRRPVLGARPVLDAGDDSAIRRRTTRACRRGVDARTAHARYFAGREADVLALWDSPRQREAYSWFTVELANLRAAFRWAADHDDLDTAAAIAVYAAFLGTLESSSTSPSGGPKSSSSRRRSSNTDGSRSCTAMAALCYS